MSEKWPGAATMPQIPFRRVFTKLNRPVPTDATIVTAFTDGQVTLRSNRAKIGYHEAADLSGFQGVEAGDFVIHGLDIMRGSVGVSDSTGAISAVCIVCKPSHQVDPRYIAYAIRLQAASGYPKALARGVREGGADFRRWATLAELPVPVPSVSAQRAVADYLDRETAQIDTLIAKQEQLITTLRERRAAVVARAVLGHTPASDPAGWSTRPLRHWMINRDNERIPLSADERGLMQGDFDYYGASGVIDHVDRYLFDRPLVLIGEDGANLRLRGSRLAFVARGKYWVNNHAHILEPRSGPAEFWADRLEAVDYEPLITGSAQPKLTSAALMSMRISAPTAPEEQERIVSYIAARARSIDTLITKAERFIELSKERRAALITAAVTGQLQIPN